MGLSEESILEMKELLEKKKGKEVTMAEATEAAHNLYGLVKLLYELQQKEYAREKKLEEFPKGYPLVGSYTCPICNRGMPDEDGSKFWYDKFGIKCMICQEAINKKVIPGSVCTKKDSWYSKYDLESRFNLKGATLKSWIKKGILKDRVIMNKAGRVHCQIFLIKDNADTLPPKKMTDSQGVSEEKDGYTWHRLEPWYKFVDPREHLKDYKIMDHVSVTQHEPEMP